MGQDQEAFNPMIQTWHSKIDLPTPNPMVLYCVRKIENYPELGYAYLTVLVDRSGEQYQTVLFYNYAPMQNYSRFVEDIRGLVPLHCTNISDYSITFHKEKECPCGWKQTGDALC